MQGASFGKYQVVELIGEGGFGRVFKGLDPDLKRPVAIKTCSLSEPEMRERFFREAEIAARLHHPNITTVYDFGREEGEPYLVQEYLTGEDLDHIIKEGRDLPLATKIQYLIQVGEGLGYAHSQGVIHRDVKPANIRVLDDGQVRIMDFGIARLVEETQRFTQAGMTIGTAGYLSPEQLQGLDVDHRSDIFSFGVLAYEFLLNRAPFQGESISALFYAIAHEEPAPIGEVWAECPPALAACISRCLEKNRDTRYGSFKEVTADLRNALAEVEGGGPVPVKEGRAAVPAVAAAAAAEGSPRRGRRWLYPVWAIVGIAILVALFEVVRFPGRGASSPAEEGGGGVPAADSMAAAPGGLPQVAGEEGAQEEPGLQAQETDVGAGGAGDPGSGSGAAQDPGQGAEVSPGAGAASAPAGAPGSGATPDREVAPPPATAETRPAAAEPVAEAEAPYRGTSTLVLFWSGGGDPGSVTTAENAFLEEMERRRLQVVDAGLLAGIHQDAASVAAAQGMDARAVSNLGRDYGAEVVVVGSLRTEAAPSAGSFYTGRAVLDVRAYRASTYQLLGSATYQVGTDNTPGELGPSPLAAETAAAKEVGRRAAVGIAREYGETLPRRR